MLTKDIGLYYQQTQKELDTIKRELATLTNADKNGPQGEVLRNLYKRVSNDMQNIQNNIDQNSDQLFNQLMGNFDHTIQKLPTVDENRIIQSQSSKRKRRTQPALDIQQPSVNLPLIDALVQLRGKSELNYVPVGQLSYGAQGIQSQFLRKNSNKVIAKQQSSTLLKKNPITSISKISITEKDIEKNGLLGLINKGKIMNGEETKLLLNQNQSLLRNSQANIYQFKDQHAKQTIQLECESKNDLIKVDYKIKQEDIPRVRLESTLQKSNILKKINLQPVNFFGNSLSTPQIETTQLAQQKYEGITQDLKSEPIEPMSVKEVMDTFSLHNFMIRKGKVVDEAPEFQSFKRNYQTKWVSIQTIIKSLEKISSECGIQLAIVNGKALVEMAEKTGGQGVIGLAELVSCFQNDDEFIQKLRIAKLMFKGKEGRLKAIIRIQTAVRRWKAQRDYARLKIMVEKIKIIQNASRTFLLYRQTRKLIQQHNNLIIDQFKIRQQEFKRNWGSIKLQQRVEVHINNFSYEEMRRLTMEKFLQRQNSQITRIFNLRDPLVSIIYISPFDLPAEIMNYFYKILELGEISNFKERLQFVWPEHHRTYPSHYSLSRVLLLSSKSLKRIRVLIKNKPAYVVSGYPSNDDIKLSDQLKIPLFSGEPQNQLVYSTKSGCKRFFNELQIPTAPGAYEIYDEKELINTLAILIVNNPTVHTWLLKIDDECQGRGIASLEVRKLGSFLKNTSFTQNPEAVVQVAQLLVQRLPKKLNICYPYLFKDYQEYLSTFIRKGGIVEACPNCPQSQIESPSLFFRIDPDGQINVIGTFDKIKINDFQTIACSGPKTSLPHVNVQYVCQSIGERLYEKGIFGYHQLDLISFSDASENTLVSQQSSKQTGNQLFWAIGLDCFLTSMSSSCFYFDFLMRGKLDTLTGQYSVSMQNNSSKSQQESIQSKENLHQIDGVDQKRSFLYCPLIINEGLDSLQYKTFFQLCRLESISFNLEKKVGSTFILIDSLQSGAISIMTIGNQIGSTLKYMSDAFEFLIKNVGKGQDFQDVLDSRTDKIRMMAIHQKIKYFMKRTDKLTNNSKQQQGSYSVYL